MAENDLAQFQESLVNHLSAQIEDDDIFTGLSIESSDQDQADYLATFDCRNRDGCNNPRPTLG